MTPLAQRANSRSVAALASAAITLLAFCAIAPALAQTAPQDPSWDGSYWSSPLADGQTIADGVFSGTFVHEGTAPEITSVDLYVDYASAGTHDPACDPAPGYQTTQTRPTTTTTEPSTATTEPTTPTTGPTTTSAPTNSTMDFLFEVAFRCNGIYDATATATLGSPGPVRQRGHDLTLHDINIAVPPQPPLGFVASDSGNRTVALSWSAPKAAPPDLVGYRLSRMDAGGSTFAVLGTTIPTVLTYTDANIPATGGSYFYRIETLRKAPVPTNPPLASTPITTTDALVVGGTGGSVPSNSNRGSSGGGAGDQTPGGPTHFDEPSTLAADEGEPGSGDLALPGAGAIQRFAGRDGAGLVTPFAAALDLAVWAGLLLFLTRRAANAARADALTVELEHLS